VVKINFTLPIQDKILLVEDRMISQADGHHPELGSALKHLLSSGGKRIRPAVALLTGAMYGANPERLITLGAAIELLHTATLVHDDLIDGALLRRGMATLNAQWSPGATVLTGDYVFARAAKLAAETESITLMRMFAETLATIVNGEITQMFTSRGVASRDDYFQRIYAKTASLFELATTAASILGSVEVAVEEEAKQFGRDVGMAFQIVDDLLDFTGEQATLGKPVASDLRQGLITLPTLIYLEMNPDDPEMNSLLEGHFFNDERMDSLVRSIRDSGAVDRAMIEAQLYIERALEILHRQPECEERVALEELTRYIADRRL
jgi:geranylgeranyl pyrophosphate synthase